MPSTAPEGRLHVVAGVLEDAGGRVLVARRPEHLHQGGLWEFPGGKREPGETPQAALARELREELGIEADPAGMRPLIAVPWDYGDRRLLLDVWRVTRWQGRPAGREGQRIEWLEREGLSGLPLPAADRPVVDALTLPPCCLVTPAPVPGEEARFLDLLARALERRDVGLVVFRAHGLDEAAYLRLLERVAGLRGHGDFLLHAYGDPARLRDAGADGVHLMATTLDDPPLVPETMRVSVSAHDARELALAARLEARFAFLSPVRATASHPGRAALGWTRFADLVAEAPLPVYALGGVGPDDVDRVRACGGQGVAAIRALWPEPLA